MATEVLRPQDILIERLRVSPSPLHRRRSNYGNGNGYFNPRSSYYGNRVKTERERSEKKKLKNQPDPLMRRRSASSDDLRPTHNGVKSNGGINMGQLRIPSEAEISESNNATFCKSTPTVASVHYPSEIPNVSLDTCGHSFQPEASKPKFSVVLTRLIPEKESPNPPFKTFDKTLNATGSSRSPTAVEKFVASKRCLESPKENIYLGRSPFSWKNITALLVLKGLLGSSEVLVV
ncbi:hypothetical protein K7X08_004784 [Anisodus acutangulus]|uniref:Uncharacterized protein n=1 Tax=Anisodus acutangulus TaxID=402998 RepID=A0A9Q1MHG4_9SOLA|nr:hypothetical protein K7X08_004784 [Anisodus acutangulus]